MWRLAQASVAGTSHVTRGVGCEDSCASDVIVSTFDGHVLVALVADGAGSASHGGAAAEAACSYGLERIRLWLTERTSPESPSASDLRQLLADIREHILAAAAAQQGDSRDWACTLLVAICADRFACFMQIGDGAIVVQSDAELRPVFWPTSGEYVNETVFLSGERSVEGALIDISETAPLFLALFTDGLQPVALHFASKQAFGPFFRPLLDSLSDQSRSEDVEGKLFLLLNSSALNQRTDDDKTIVIARRSLPAAEAHVEAV